MEWEREKELRELLAVNEKEKNELRDQVKLLNDGQQLLLSLLKGLCSAEFISSVHKIFNKQSLIKLKGNHVFIV